MSLFITAIAVLAALAVSFALIGTIVTWILARRASADAPPTGRLIDTPIGRLHLHDLGDASHAVPILLLHGASANGRDMVMALGERLAVTARVLVVDRPGHGWSDRPAGAAEADPAHQARRIIAGLDALGITQAVVVGHSWSGTLATSLALDHPGRVAGLVLVAAVTHPWPGGAVAWYNRLVARPILGRLFAWTVATPAAALLLHPGIRAVFTPDAIPDDYDARTATRLLLRPSEFRANGQDLCALYPYVCDRAPRYGEIAVPATAIHGLADDTVWASLHAEAFARSVAGCRLVLLPRIGHMPHHAAADVIVDEVLRVTQMVGRTPVRASPAEPAGLDR